MISRLCIVFVNLSVCLSMSKDSEIKMIADVLQSFNKPSNVIAELCWRSSFKKQLSSQLAMSYDPKSIKYTPFNYSRDLINKETIIFLVDLNCPESLDILRQGNLSKTFAKPYRWFLIGMVINDEKDTLIIPTELDELSILPDSEVYIAQYTGNDTYSIKMIYKIKPHLNWIVENYADWNEDIGLVRSRSKIDLTTSMRRRNLAGEIIVSSMLISDNGTIEDLEYLRNPEIDAVSKAGYLQLTSLYEFTNATRQLLFTDVWGNKINGSWTGVLGDLDQGKAELPGSVMFITKDRMTVIDFVSHPTPTSVKFIFREPPLSYQNNLYLLPFRTSVWYCIGSFVVLLVLLVYINAYWEKQKMEQKEIYDTTVLIPNFSDVSVFVMGAISQQGSDVEPKGTLGRFVSLILLLVFLFLYTAYSASIVVLLQSRSDQIKTLGDLLHSKLELGVEDTPYNRYLFAVCCIISIYIAQNEKEPVRKAIYDQKIAPRGSTPKFYDLVEGVRLLQKKPFAFNCDQGAAYKVMEKYFYEHEKCALHEISYIQESSPWQACKKGSPYLEIFKIGLLRSSEFGLNDRTNRRLFSKKPVCSARGGSFVSVSLVDCYPSLLLLLYGMILGVVLLLAELMYHRRNGGSFVSLSLEGCYPSLLLRLYGMILGVVLLLAMPSRAESYEIEMVFQEAGLLSQEW